MTNGNRSALIFGSVTGKTEFISESICKQFQPELALELIEVSSIEAEDLKGFDFIICGIPTWDIGELEYGWQDIYVQLDGIDMVGVKIAVFGLGDQCNYADTYQDAMGILYQKMVERGADAEIGFTTTGGHDFDESLAIIDKKFCGLALDEDNQEDLSDDRIAAWVQQVKAELKLIESESASVTATEGISLS